MEFGLPKKRFGINFTKSNTNLYLSVHYNADDRYLFVNAKETIKFKAGKCLVLLSLEKYL